MKKWNNRKRINITSFQNNGIKRKKYFFTKTIKHQVIVTIITVIVVSLIVGGSAYAAFTSLSYSDYSNIKIGNLELTYDDESESVLNLESVYPETDEEGLSGNGYNFSIKNTGTLASKYVVYIGSDAAVINSDNCNSNLIDYKDIKMSLNNGEVKTLISCATSEYDADGYEIYKIEEGTLQPGETKKFNVKMWININADNSVLGKHFHGKVLINGENYNTYTTDQLNTWYDAINNSTNGYSNSVTKWYDLSNNNNDSSTFIGSNTWNENSLTLNGVVPFVGNINEEYTISMVVKPNNEGTNPYLIYGNNFPSIYLDSSDNYSLVFKGQGLTEKINPSTALSTDKPILVTITYKNDELKLYKNSTLLAVYNTTTNPVSTATAYIGGNNGSNNMKGKVYNFMLYDKALSQEEIRTNYIIDSTRFNMK